MARPRTPATHAPLSHSGGSARVRRLSQGQAESDRWVGDGLALNRNTSAIEIVKVKGVRPTAAERSFPEQESAGLGVAATITDAAPLTAHNDLVGAYNELRDDFMKLKTAYDALARGMLEAKTVER